MRTALIRLEDVGPGGAYGSAENQLKLMAVADYLYAQGVPFHVAVISRFVDPPRGIDRDIGNRFDVVAAGFVRTLQALVKRGASLGMHGYTHQFGRSVSGDGYEFAYSGCKINCPPDDPPETLRTLEGLRGSYAYGRFLRALSSFQAAGLFPDWFETPHYAVSDIQRRILEACCWLMYEDPPDVPNTRRITARSSLSILGKTYYVPTPLGYVGGASVNEDVRRMLKETADYDDEDLASFFYHPFLEFPYIHLRGNASPFYEEHTPLKTLIRTMLADGRRFRRLPFHD